MDTGLLLLALWHSLESHIKHIAARLEQDQSGGLGGLGGRTLKTQGS